jgi:hypothetical protein
LRSIRKGLRRACLFELLRFHRVRAEVHRIAEQLAQDSPPERTESALADRIDAIRWDDEAAMNDMELMGLFGSEGPDFDSRTGESVEVEIFIAVLGASNLAYAEAARSPEQS